MSAPGFEAIASTTGVAKELSATQFDDGLPKDPICEHRLPSGIPLDAHARVTQVLEQVSGEWRVTDTVPRYERTWPSESPSTFWHRIKEKMAWRKRLRLEQSVGNTALRAPDAAYYSILNRLA